MSPTTPSSTRVPRATALSYGVGSIGTGVYSTVPGLLLLFYLTDLVGVGAGTASLVLLVPKLWDALLNPFVGAWSDRVGARSPFLLAGAIGVPVLFALLFSAPDLGGPGATALYVAVVYTLAMTAFALFQVPYVALPAEITDDYHERTRLISVRMVLLTVGILVGGALAPALAGGKDGGREGYARMSLVVAAVLAAALLTAWRGTRGVPTAAPTAGPRVTLRAQIGVVRGNPAFLALFLGYTLQAVAIGAMLAGAPYIATYVLDDNALASVLFVCLVAPAALVMPLWRRLSLRTGKLTGYLAASLVFAVAAAGLVTARSLPTYGVLLLTAVLGTGYAGMQLFPYAMLPDAISADRGADGPQTARPAPTPASGRPARRSGSPSARPCTPWCWPGRALSPRPPTSGSTRARAPCSAWSSVSPSCRRPWCCSACSCCAAAVPPTPARQHRERAAA